LYPAPIILENPILSDIGFVDIQQTNHTKKRLFCRGLTKRDIFANILCLGGKKEKGGRDGQSDSNERDGSSAGNRG